MEQTKLETKAEELGNYEKRLQELHKEEIKNRFEIGRILSNIKNKKLYYYKDSTGDYTWENWCREFMGSRRTADRYLGMWHHFIHYYKYSLMELDGIAIRRLDMMLPLLGTGEAKNKKEVDKMLEMARTIPEDGEFRKALLQKDMTLEEVMECVHVIKYYAQCSICGEKRSVGRSIINNPEEIEAKFK